MNAECTPRGHALGELGDHLRVERIVEWTQMTMPFLRSDAPSRVKTRYLPSGVVITSLTCRVFMMIESTIVGFAGSLMSMRVEHVTAAARAEVGDLAVRDDPDFLGGEAGARHPADAPSAAAGRRAARG